MVHPLEPTIKRHNDKWRVCYNGMCRDHAQDWQAFIFFHQMLNRSTSPEALERAQHSNDLDG